MFWKKDKDKESQNIREQIGKVLEMDNALRDARMAVEEQWKRAASSGGIGTISGMLGGASGPGAFTAPTYVPWHPSSEQQFFELNSIRQGDIFKFQGDIWFRHQDSVLNMRSAKRLGNPGPEPAEVIGNLFTVGTKLHQALEEMK